MVVGASASHSRTVSSRSRVKPVVPTTAWIPWSIANRMLSMTTSGWVKSTSTCEPASATLNSQSPASTIATTSRSGAASTALQTCWPIRPRAPRTPTLIGSLMKLASVSYSAVEVVVAERADNRQAARSAEQVTGELDNIFRCHGIDAGEQLVDAEHVAVDDLALTDPGHPGTGVLEAEHHRAAHLALATLDLVRAEAAARGRVKFGHDEGQHLVGLARLTTGVDAEHAAVGVTARERVHRVRQPAFLANPLEQPGTHPAAECSRQHSHREPAWVVPGQSVRADDQVGLLGVVRAQRRGPTRRPRSAATAPREDRHAVWIQSSGERGADQPDDLVMLEVSRRRHDHRVGRVSTAVVAVDLPPGQLKNGRLGAEDRPTQRDVAVERRGELVVGELPRVVVAHRDLFEDNTPLDVDVRAGHRRAEHDVGDDVERQRQIPVEHDRVVAGVLLLGERVELTAHRIHGFRDVQRRATGGALEQQVLEEMAGAGEGGRLVAGTDGHPDADARATDPRH